MLGAVIPVHTSADIHRSLVHRSQDCPDVHYEHFEHLSYSACHKGFVLCTPRTELLQITWRILCVCVLKRVYTFWDTAFYPAATDSLLSQQLVSRLAERLLQDLKPTFFLNKGLPQINMYTIGMSWSFNGTIVGNVCVVNFVEVSMFILNIRIAVIIYVNCR